MAREKTERHKEVNHGKSHGKRTRKQQKDKRMNHEGTEKKK